ncbi:hypothetical protein PVK06_024342 [Gossypium arboreum]|uniref:Uncharacterized protein n=1 Tax=Gossypium arboreum TaxID=29729 RepID=A0ABR0PDG8_GOSAR|nr:hypothetical protein PVK06_024342 [Gossypium arboreum]
MCRKAVDDSCMEDFCVEPGVQPKVQPEVPPEMYPKVQEATFLLELMTNPSCDRIPSYAAIVVDVTSLVKFAYSSPQVWILSYDPKLGCAPCASMPTPRRSSPICPPYVVRSCLAMVVEFVVYQRHLHAPHLLVV